MKNGNDSARISRGKADGRQYELPPLLSVSPAPHIRTLDTTRSIMIDVIIALLPAALWGVYTFGLRALYIILISVAASVGAEAVFQALCHKTVTVADMSAALTGLILGLSMPSGVSLWVPAVGAVFAVIIAKQLFGGIGKNIVNPAIAARVFLMLCWPDQMVRYVDVRTDLVSAATPLTFLKSGIAPSESIFRCVLGNMSGCIGEVSAIALFAGFIYLLARRVVSWQLPVGFIGTVAAVTFVFPSAGDNLNSMMYQLFCGSLMFTALISANDFSTIPVTKWGRLIFGIGCGAVTLLIRYFGAYPDGTAFAVLLMNLLVPIFEKWTSPRVFGKKAAKGGAQA